MKKLLLSLAVIFALMVSGIAQTTTDGLVGYWKFDEGSGTVVGDELGTTNGELVNSVDATWADGYSGKALDFSQTSGVASYARFDGSGAANIDGSLSIAMWIKADLTLDGEQSIISKGVPYLLTGDPVDGFVPDGGWYHLSLKNGAIRFMIWDVSTLSSPGGELPIEITWDPNTWYHVAVVRDKENAVMNVYLNGQLISTDTDGLMESMANQEDLTFGSVAHGVQSEEGDAFWGSHYKGCLDEVQLYNKALTGEEIAGIYDAYINGGGSGKSIAYVTKQKDMAEGAWPVENDVIIQMLNADPNVDLTVLVTDGDGNIDGAAVDLSGYDAIVAAETYGSGDNVWKSGYPLYIGTLPVPAVYNKIYSFRSGKALTTGAGASSDATGIYDMAVDAPTHAIFSGIDVSSGKFTIAKGGVDDSGGTTYEKCMQYNTGNVVTGTTLLGHPDGISDAVLSFDDIAPNATIDEVTVPVQVYSFAMNSGQLTYKSTDGTNINLTTEGLTFWRNAIYLAAGIDVPTTPVDFTISARSIAVNEIGVYPNPAVDQICVGGIENGTQVTVYSALGQKVAATIANGNEATIDVSNFKKGIYMVKVERNGKASVGRFIKK